MSLLIESVAPKRRYRHGHKKMNEASPEYISWLNMRARCLNPNSTSFPRYGARGISICHRWDDFLNFLEDMGRKPATNYSIERRNNNENYSPENCFWATKKEQARNRRSSLIIEHEGVSKTLSEWVETSPASYGTVHQRIKNGWDFGKALSTHPRSNRRKIT